MNADYLADLTDPTLDLIVPFNDKLDKIMKSFLHSCNPFTKNNQERWCMMTKSAS